LVILSGGGGWYSTIQEAIDAVDGAHTVLVYEGTYELGGYVYFNGSNDNNTTVKSVCGPDSTIISFSGTTAVYFLSNTGSTLDGFSVTGASNNGILLNGADPLITNCKIYGNGAEGIDTGNSGSTLNLTNSEVYSNARGVYINGGSGHAITGTTIRDNTMSGGGAGVLTSGDVTFTDTVIKDNNATSGNGGGVFSNSAALEFYRCTITGNVASGRSGAIELGNSGATAYVENSIIADNQATDAGASYLNGGRFTAVNTTFVNNEATDQGGVFFSNSGIILVGDSILWNNYAATAGHIVYFNWGSCS
jgi:hypothetical protein